MLDGLIVNVIKVEWVDEITIAIFARSAVIVSVVVTVLHFVIVDVDSQ